MVDEAKTYGSKQDSKWVQMIDVEANEAAKQSKEKDSKETPMDETSAPDVPAERKSPGE